MASSLSHPPKTLSSLLHKTLNSITTPQKSFLSTSNFTSSKLIKHLLYNKNRVVKGLIPRTSVDVIEDPILEEDVKEEKARALRVGIVCGGPSAERGISLNSARLVIDHIQGDDIDVKCYYIDCDLNASAILSAQELLEKVNIPFVGTRSNECHRAFDKQVEQAEIDDLMELVGQIIVFLMKHNVELEAIDLFMEVEELDLLTKHVDATNYKRSCLYLTSSASYLPGPDDMLMLDIAHTIYLKFKEYPSALRVALFLDNLQMCVLCTCKYAF